MQFLLWLTSKENSYSSDFITATMVKKKFPIFLKKIVPTGIVQLRVTRSLFLDKFPIPNLLIFLLLKSANLIDLVNLSSSSIFWIVSWWRIWSIKAFENHLHQLCIQLLDFESASRIIIFHRQALLLHFTLKFFALFDDGQCKQQD